MSENVLILASHLIDGVADSKLETIFPQNFECIVLCLLASIAVEISDTVQILRFLCDLLIYFGSF